MQAAGKSNLKRVSLELGGKSPFIIFGDVNGMLNFKKLSCKHHAYFIYISVFQTVHGFNFCIRFRDKMKSSCKPD